MRRKFLLNIVFLLSVSLVVKAFWVLGIDRTVQNVAGEEAYGFYFSLFSFSVLFTLVLDMGLSGFNNRAISADPSRVKAYFGNVLLLRLALTVAYFIVTLTTAWLLGYSSKQFSLLLVLMLNQVIASLILWLRSNISGMQYLFLDSLLSVSDRLIMIVICSVLLWGGVTSSHFRIEWFVWSQTAAYLVVFIIALFIVIRRGKVSGVRADASLLKDIMVTGIPYAVVAFTMTLYWRTDSVMIERMLPDGMVQAGNYAQSFRLFDAFAMIPVMFGGLLLPIFSREYAGGNDITPLASMASRLLMAPLGIIALTLATWPSEVLDILYIKPAEGSTVTFRILMVTLIPVGVTFIYSTMLTATGRIRQLGKITAAAMAINIIVNLILVPSMAGRGAAISALITQLFVAAACLTVVNKTMQRVTPKKRVISFMILFLFVISAGLFFYTLHIQWYLAAALQLILGAVAALILRLIEPMKSIKLLLQK